MEHPVEEIAGVVEQLCTAATPDEQKAAVEKWDLSTATPQIWTTHIVVLGISRTMHHSTTPSAACRHTLTPERRS